MNSSERHVTIDGKKTASRIQKSAEEVERIVAGWNKLSPSEKAKIHADKRKQGKEFEKQNPDALI